MIQTLLGKLAAGEDLAINEMAGAIDAIMQGDVPSGQIALLLMALRSKGETPAELAGAAVALRRNMLPIACDHERYIDTCGTGGDGSGTFNISTAAALVTAAAGVPVAKHGNRKITSKTGSADVLLQLGVNIEATVEQVQRCLAELGICFCFAPLLHPAMKQVAAVRRELGVPTIFNLLGPLSNPASAPYQLLGVGKPHLRPLLAEALQLLGIKRALVVCGRDGLDEVTIAAATDITEVAAGAEQAGEFAWQPEDFGLEQAPLESMRINGPEESAAMIEGILAGKAGPARDIVLLNAAAALYTVGTSTDPAECARHAADAIDSGRAAELLARLADLSHH